MLTEIENYEGQTASETSGRRKPGSGQVRFDLGRLTSYMDRSDESGATLSRQGYKSVRYVPAIPQNESVSLSSAYRGLSVDEYFKPIKNWEGVVESIAGDEFTAIVRDLDNPADNGEERFEISIKDVSAGDHELIVPGGVFYFTIGYWIRKGGTRLKATQVLFRRLPTWSKKKIQRASVRADHLLEILQRHTQE